MSLLSPDPDRCSQMHRCLALPVPTFRLRDSLSECYITGRRLPAMTPRVLVMGDEVRGKRTSSDGQSQSTALQVAVYPPYWPTVTSFTQANSWFFVLAKTGLQTSVSARGQDQWPWRRNPSLVTAATNHLWVINKPAIDSDIVIVNNELSSLFRTCCFGVVVVKYCLIVDEWRFFSKHDSEPMAVWVPGHCLACTKVNGLGYRPISWVDIELFIAASKSDRFFVKRFLATASSEGEEQD